MRAQVSESLFARGRYAPAVSVALCICALYIAHIELLITLQVLHFSTINVPSHWLCNNIKCSSSDEHQKVNRCSDALLSALSPQPYA